MDLQLNRLQLCSFGPRTEGKTKSHHYRSSVPSLMHRPAEWRCSVSSPTGPTSPPAARAHVSIFAPSRQLDPELAAAGKAANSFLVSRCGEKERERSHGARGQLASQFFGANTPDKVSRQPRDGARGGVAKSVGCDSLPTPSRLPPG